MKLIEALKLAGAPQEGPAFHALLACGFTPLHLETALKARFRLALPKRTVHIQTGLYGDLAGTLEQAGGNLHAALVTLEWSDLDPRLGWRSAGTVDSNLLNDIRLRLDRFAARIGHLATACAVVVSLPALPLPPVFINAAQEMSKTEANLRAMVFEWASALPAVALHPDAITTFPTHDLRAELSSGFPYSFAFADALAERLVSSVLPTPTKKGLITDLDGTLWDGILGDDGVEGISWDLEHKTYFHALYQNLLGLLSESGVLVGVASKNDPDLVKQALGRPDLLLDKSRLFPVEAHWEPKATSVERILRTWNISAEAAVFVDDNMLELEQIKASFPDLQCLEFRLNDPEFLLSVRELFARREVRDEDRLRTESLRNSKAIREASSEAASLDTLLASADAKLTIYEGKQPLDSRALELINKTNQFNLNGQRYGEADWRQFLARPDSRLIIIDYQDRFGRLGKVAVIAGRQQKGSFEVSSWVMSCRAFSRRIEHQCLRYLFDHCSEVRLQFLPTNRNGPLQSFLSEISPTPDVITRSEFEKRCPPLFHTMEVVHVSDR
jgi:FkbH-like protein